MAFFPTQDLVAKPVENYVFDTNTMSWVAETQPGGGSGGAVTVADGADVAEGSTTDVAVNGDNPGTVSAKLRGLNKLFSDVWDSVNHWLQVKVMNTVTVTGTVTATTTNDGTFAKETGGNLAEIALDTDNLANLDVALSTRLKPADTLTKVATVDTITNPVSTKSNLSPASVTAVSVGVASGLAVAANSSRKGLVLVNTSTSYISLGFGVAAVLYSGITLNPAGGTFVMDEFMFNTGTVNAIASAASSNLAIQEYS